MLIKFRNLSGRLAAVMVGGEGECSATVQTGLEAHPVSCTMGKTAFFSGVKLSGCVVGLPPTSNSEDEARIELYHFPRLCLHITL